MGISGIVEEVRNSCHFTNDQLFGEGKTLIRKLINEIAGKNRPPHFEEMRRPLVLLTTLCLVAVLFVL